MFRRDYGVEDPHGVSAVKTAAYSHQDLLKDMSEAMSRGEIKGKPEDLKPKGPSNMTPIKSGGILEVLHDMAERTVPQIEKYIEKFNGGSFQDEVLPADFRKHVGAAAKAYSEVYSRLLEVQALLSRPVKVATAGGKDHAIISLLEEISETGAKQGFKKLKAIGFSFWVKEFFGRVKNLEKAVEGLSFK